VARQLRVVPDETVTVTLSDGSEKTRPLADVRMEFDGVKRTVPVSIAPDGEQALLGYTALEILRLKVDPITRKLERTSPIEF
jgi:predicted aspartyl protease